MNSTRNFQYLFNRTVMLVFAALAPLLFLIAQNQHMYSMSQIAASIFFVALLCVVFYRISVFAIMQKINKSDRFTILKGKVDIAALAISLILLCFLICLFGILYLTGNTAPGKHPFLIVCFYALILFTIGLGFSAVQSRIFGIALYSFVLMSIIQFTNGIIHDSQIFSAPVTNRISIPSAIEKVQLKKKPNIYLFLLESIHSRDVLKNVYGIDTNEFSKKLVSYGYTLYDPIYANYFPTLSSTASLFTMDHSYYSDFRGNMDVTTKTSQVISGGDNNKVINILINNGYSIAYIHSDSYLSRFKNKKVDYCNNEYSNAIFTPILAIELKMAELISPIFKHFHGLREATRTILVPSLSRAQTLMPHIIKSDKTGQPVFRFIYWIGAVHANNSPVAIGNHKFKTEYASAWKSEYVSLVQKTESDILYMVQQIEKKDPSALVILLGDHGALLKACMVENKQEANATSASLEELKKYSANFGFTLTDLTKDVSSVFCAIKWPKDLSVPSKRPISHVNLFRLIFSALSGDETLISEAVPNTSYYLVTGNKPKVFTTVKEGVVLNDWEQIDYPGK